MKSMSYKMIGFKSFLVESRSAPLYHGTNMFSILNILQTGTILPRTLHAIRHNRSYKIKDGISASRNYQFSLNWARKKATDSFNHAVIYFDQRKISQDFKIVPYQYFDNRAREQEKLGSPIKNEYEEFIIIPKNKSLNIKKYVNQIDYMYSSRIEDELELLKTKYPNIKFKHI